MEHTIQVEKEDMIFNVLSIGEVKSGETASATITGKEPNQVLNLTLPKGDTGNTGAKGDKGDKGDAPVKGTDYWTNTDKQEIVSNVLNEIDIPTKTSDLTNDSGFITNAVSDLINYYLKDNTYSKNEINTLVNNITKVTISIVDTLPTTGESNIIYFVSKEGSTNDVYDEYVWISNAWEHIGSTNIDLTGYATETWVNTQIANFLTEAQVNILITNALTNYALKSEIPTKNSQLQNDSGFITNYTETDPTVPNHVKNISQADISNWNGKANVNDIPDVSSFITQPELETFLSEMGNLSVKEMSVTNQVRMLDLDVGIYKTIFTQSGNVDFYYSNGSYRKITVMAGTFAILIRPTNHNWILIQDNNNIIYTGIVGPSSGSNLSLVLDSQILSKTNTSSYTPTKDYNPATKKYVDDNKFSGNYNDLINKPTIPTFTLDGTILNINTEA